MNTDQTVTTISFTKVNGPYGWLSNMSPYPVADGNLVWPTSEHLFQARRFAVDDMVRELIRTTRSPMGAKMKAKAHLDRAVIRPRSFEDISNMLYCVRSKLCSHPGLIDLLRATGDATLVEDVTRRPRTESNDFWGMRLVGDTWVGRNTLGRVWAALRDEALRRTVPLEPYRP